MNSFEHLLSNQVYGNILHVLLPNDGMLWFRRWEINDLVWNVKFHLQEQENQQKLISIDKWNYHFATRNTQ